MHSYNYTLYIGCISMTAVLNFSSSRLLSIFLSMHDSTSTILPNYQQPCDTWLLNADPRLVYLLALVLVVL